MTDPLHEIAPSEVGTGFNFAIVTRPRSGSNMLVSILNGHPNVHCYGELFHPKKVQFGLDRTRGEQTDTRPETLDSRVRDPLDFLRRVAAGTSAPMRGFKHIVEHNRGIVTLLAGDPELKILLLLRRDTLAEYRSRARAEQTNVWFELPGADGPDTPRPEAYRPVELSGMKFLRFLQRKHAEQADIDDRLAMASAEGRVLRVFYEELLKDAAARERVLDFLGLDRSVAADLTPGTSVQRKTPTLLRQTPSYRLLSTAYRLFGEAATLGAIRGAKALRAATIGRSSA